MKTKKFLTFSIFVFIAIIVSLFIYAYKTNTTQLVEAYVSDITTCGNILSEANCYDRNFCEGIYGPSCLGCGDVSFQKCVRVPETRLAEIEKQSVLCEATGGQYYRSNLGNACMCDSLGLNKVFDINKGCINK